MSAAKTTIESLIASPAKPRAPTSPIKPKFCIPTTNPNIAKPKHNTATEDIKCEYSGDEIEIGFNAKYLQEISNQVESGEAIFLFNDVGDPALMKDNNDDTAVYVVMPMRV